MLAAAAEAECTTACTAPDLHAAVICILESAQPSPAGNGMDSMEHMHIQNTAVGQRPVIANTALPLAAAC